MSISSALTKTAREKSYYRVTVFNFSVVNESLFLRGEKYRPLKSYPLLSAMNQHKWLSSSVTWKVWFILL